jgi:hypothetical protein
VRDLKWRKSYHLVIYWSFCFLDAKGRPGGLVRGSSNSMKLIHSFSQNVGIQRHLGSKEQGKVVSIIDFMAFMMTERFSGITLKQGTWTQGIR